MNKLTLDDLSVGLPVRYVPLHARGNSWHHDCQNGIVTSKNEHCAFVRFKGSHPESVGTATPVEYLIRWDT